MANRWKNTISAVSLILSSLAVLFVIFEVGLRLAGYRGAPQSYISNIYEVDDAVLDWRYTPNSEVRIGSLVFKYNAAGFRDVDHRIEKAAEIRRIVVVGDSVSEGTGVAFEDVFARKLQSRLGTRHEVINIAASGLNTPQEVHLFEVEGLKYAPDLVILNLVLNDADFYSNIAGAKRHHEKKDSRIGLLNISINPEFKRFLKSSALVYFVNERVANVVTRMTGAGHARSEDYYVRLWADQTNQAKVTGGFDRLSELAERESFDFVVIIWPLLTDFDSYRYRHVHDWIAEQARARAFPSIDLLEAFSAVSYRKLQVAGEDNFHPNRLGHSLAVDRFLDWYLDPSAKTQNGAGSAAVRAVF